MTPDELQIVIGALSTAVSGQPVLVEIDGERRLLNFVEATTDGRMVLHVMARNDATPYPGQHTTTFGQPKDES